MVKAAFVLKAFADKKETAGYWVWRVSRLKKMKVKAWTEHTKNTVLKKKIPYLSWEPKEPQPQNKVNHQEAL